MAKTDLNIVRRELPYFYQHDVKVIRSSYYDNAGVKHPAVWVIDDSWSTTNAPKTPFIVLKEKRTGGSTPGFLGPNRPRLLPVNGFEYSKWQRKSSYGMTRTHRPGSNGEPPVDSLIIQSPTDWIQSDLTAIVSDADIAAAERQVAMNLRNKVKNQSINVAQAFAERRQTADTVANAAKTIARAVRAVRRGDVVGAAKALGVKPPRGSSRSRSGAVADAAAARWLELQYGWKPLLNDAFGAAEALAKSQNNVQFMRQSAQKTVSRSIQEEKSLLPSSDVKGFDRRVLKGDESVTIRYGVTYKQSSRSVSTAKELGFTNPAQLAWELVPFSFVADWFLPIGNFLSSLDATLGLEFVSGYRTIFRRRSGFAAWDSNYLQYGATFTRHVFNDWEGVVCSRTTLSGFPQITFPPFKNPVSVTHAINAIALLHQLFRK